MTFAEVVKGFYPFISRIQAVGEALAPPPLLMRFAVLTSDVASCIFPSPGGWKSIRRSRKRTKSQIERVFNAVGRSENL